MRQTTIVMQRMNPITINGNIARVDESNIKVKKITHAEPNALPRN